MPKRKLPPIHPQFVSKKNTILSALSVPTASYTDASPKGSVDEGIVPLIAAINRLDGVVTTSSCAGRVSVFCEGSKNLHAAVDVPGAIEDGGSDSVGGVTRQQQDGSASFVPGGKGHGGHWLYVSHSPVDIPAVVTQHGSFCGFLGLSPSLDSGLAGQMPAVKEIRLVRLQFEPLILHLCTSSLAHASPLLSAAINVGFRESGIQSLKNLDDDHAFPTLAIRTQGLSFETVVGYALDDSTSHSPGVTANASDSEHANGRGANSPKAIVDDSYLKSMLEVVNERFEANVLRTQRLTAEIERLVHVQEDRGKVGKWEDTKERAERKKMEGLARRRILEDGSSGKATELEDEAGLDGVAALGIG